MGGLHQLDRLVRKNILLKTRRPKGTCFEFTLPIILFLIIAVTRKKYNTMIETLGPFDYEPSSIFPLSRSLFDDGSIPQSNETSSDAEGGGGNASDANGNQPSVGSTLTREVLCDPSLHSLIQDLMKPVLAVQVSKDTTLAEELQTVSATNMSHWVEDAMLELQAWDLARFVDSLDAVRRDYLDSYWAERAEMIARHAEAELAQLREDMHRPSSAGLGDRANGWVNDTCYLKGSVWRGWNSTRLATELQRLYQAMEVSGFVAWVNGSRNSAALKPLRLILNATGADANHGMAIIERMVAQLQETDAEDAAEWADQAAWWLSHFLRPRSMAAMAIGERPNGTQWEYGGQGTMNGGARCGHSGQTLGGNGISAATVMNSVDTVTLPTTLRTDMGHDTFCSMKQWQDDPMDVSEWPEPEWPKPTPSSVLALLDSMIKDLALRSPLAIEQQVLPKWEMDWRTDRLNINASSFGRTLERMQGGCPFYRYQVKKSAEYNMSDVVKQLHVDMSSWDAESLKEELGKWQEELKRFDAKDVSQTVREVIDSSQLNTVQSTPRANSTVVERVANQLTEKLLGEIRSSMGTVCHAPGTRQKLPDNDAENGDVNAILANLLSRKFLVAPYTGEAKKLWDLIIVELVVSLTEVRHGNVKDGFMNAFLRCPVVRALASKLISFLLEDRVLSFQTEKELEDYALQNADDVMAALVFRNTDEAGDFAAEGLNIHYAVRAAAQLLPSTKAILRRSRMMQGDGDTGPYPYIELGFAYLQDVVGRAAARLRAQREAAVGPGNRNVVSQNIAAHNRTALSRRLAINTEQYPTPQFRKDRFVYLIQYTLPLVMVLGWIYAISLLVKEIVYEKQELLRDVMRIMGLRTWVYRASWISSAMAQMSVLVCIIVLLMSGGGILTYSNPFLIFVFFMLYSGAIVSLAMAISACFSRAKVAAACAGVIYYGLYFPYNLYGRFEDKMSLGRKCFMCLPCPTAMGIGMSIVAKWELVEDGLQWSNLALPPPITNSGMLPNNGFSFMHVVLMLVVDIFVYQFFAWYVEKVFPGSLGLPQPWYFLFVPSYWCGQVAIHKNDNNGDSSAMVEQEDNQKLECYEAPPPDLDVVARIRRLAKTFRRGKHALKGISLDMHRGTIVGLLGHNGAGKTTTMSILTGLYPPSEGDVHVNGCSVRADSYGVRKQLGVCLQHNALWEMLTVEEHLRLFCNLKSVPSKRMAADVDRLLQDTGLTFKRSAASGALSGGMKRKLSIGIALAGSSQVIVLDEPTAGVDATSRRDIWHLLAAYKSDRAILLSTHFMDEADVLSDRIAIIAEGELTAIGSSMALKRRFADAYMLVLVVSDAADSAKLLEAVRAVVPEAHSAGSRGREHSYALPASTRPQFATLFATLEEEEVRRRLGVETYGLSAATMEEVFLHASSVHEEGLHGCVRNNADSAAPPQFLAVSPAHNKDGSEVSTDEGSNSNSGSNSRSASHSQIDHIPSNEHVMGESGGDAPSASLTQNAEPKKEEAQGPCSPQCSILTESPESSQRAQKKLLDALASDPVEVNGIGGKHITLVEGARLWRQQLHARLWKRAVSSRRDRKAWASQLLLPAAFVLLALVIAKILEYQGDAPALRLSTDMYTGTIPGSRVKELANHIMPLSVEPSNNFVASVAVAFEAAKGSRDEMREVTVTGSDSHSAMSQFLLDSSQELLQESYGALSVDGSDELANVTLWFKKRAVHGIPAMVGLCNNARARLMGYDDLETQAWSHPLPKTQQLLQEEMSGDSQIMRDLSVAITVIVAMGFIPASFVVYIVHERATNSKHQQLLTGVSPLMYWISSYCWDMINYLIPAVVIFMLFLMFQLGAYSGDNSPAILLLLLLYGSCMTPFMYCFEHLFTVPSTAYVTLICTNIFTGTVSVMGTSLMDMFQADFPSIKSINDVCKAVLPWMLPNYNLGRGLIDVAQNYYITRITSDFGLCLDGGAGESCTKDPLSFDVAGKSHFYLALMSVAWFCLRLLIEWRFLTRFCRPRRAAVLSEATKVEDEAVIAEANRVTNAVKACDMYKEDSLVISHLSKSFVKSTNGRCCRRKREAVRAVRGITLGVARGECFGLLGVNGAGKTTTMRMVTGDIEVDGGDVVIGGCSIRSERDGARRHLGYCPQFNALPDKLTVRETLDFYARVRGIESMQISINVDAMSNRMCLEAHQDCLCQHLSGGNKRKLSTALSLIGEPEVVLLDEPSTGIDVGARRFLWEVLGDIRRRGHALVLTSHSMDECEVLCSRLTIMVAGEMRCLGSPLQLKAKYGGGYTLQVKALPRAQEVDSVDPCERIRGFIAAELPEAVLTEENVGLFRYRLGGGQDGGLVGSQKQQVRLADIFSSFEQAMAEGGRLKNCTSDYALSQTSLEEVFLHFSRQAEEASSA